MTGVDDAEALAVREVFEAGPPIVCFANDYRGDPTSKHHIMRILAGYTDVLWVESAGMRRPKLSNPLDLKRIAARLRRSAAGVQRDGHDRLHVMSPPACRCRAAASPRGRTVSFISARLGGHWGTWE
jgi:hypothetical protein